MSKVPTLLVPGSLRLIGDTDTSKIVPINYITTWIRQRLNNASVNLSNRVLIVRAETGSGKSTVLPVDVFRILRNKDIPLSVPYKGLSVICTQPRVLTAVALANDVASFHSPWNPDMKIGDTVGYQTGPLKSNLTSGLLFATSGLLAAQLRQKEDSEIMGKYRVIIIDEAHERSLDSDMMLLLLRNFYLRNSNNENLPFLILASATFDPVRYAKYFDVDEKNVVEIVGRSYPIEYHWPSQGTNDYPTEAANLAIKIHEQFPDDGTTSQDILIFMPGAAETQTTYDLLMRENKKYNDTSTMKPMLILRINREIIISQLGDYALVFEKPHKLPLVNGRKVSRRVIISTIVAETGLTIDTLKHVIDCGWNRSRECYQPWNIEGLVSRPAPKSKVKQRAGRVGRLFAGHFWPLYTESVYNALENQQLPDIISIGINEVILIIIKTQQIQKLIQNKFPEFKIEELELLDMPSPEAFIVSNTIANALGFVSPKAYLPKKLHFDIFKMRGDKVGYGLTQLGFIGATFSRTSMECIRMIMAGYVWDVAAIDLITIAATYGVPISSLYTSSERRGRNEYGGNLPPGARPLYASLPPFISHRVGGSAAATPPNTNEEFYFRARLLIADDFIETLLIFDAFANRLAKSHSDFAALSQWCNDVGLKFDALFEMIERRDTIIDEVIAAGMDPFRLYEKRLSTSTIDNFTERIVNIKYCLYEGLKMKLLQYDEAHPDGPSYVTLNGLKIKTPELLSDAMVSRLQAMRITDPTNKIWRPKWLITDSIQLRQQTQKQSENSAQLIYNLEAGNISILDGFVYPDINFNMARTI